MKPYRPFAPGAGDGRGTAQTLLLKVARVEQHAHGTGLGAQGSRPAGNDELGTDSPVFAARLGTMLEATRRRGNRSVRDLTATTDGHLDPAQLRRVDRRRGCQIRMPSKKRRAIPNATTAATGTSAAITRVGARAINTTTGATSASAR